MLIIIYLISLLFCYFNCRHFYISNKKIHPEWVDFLFIIFPVINTVFILLITANLIYIAIRGIDIDIDINFEKFNYFLKI